MTDRETSVARWPYGRILITGGCGFLGSHLAEYFLQHGHEVCCLDNFSTGTVQAADQLRARYPKARIITFDVTKEWKDCAELLSFAALGVSHVFHLASPASPSKYSELSLETLWANSVGLGQALDFATGVGARLIFSSSSEIYGFAEPPHAESTLGQAPCFGPRACYVESKRFGEALVYSHNQRYGTAHGVVRIFNTYGPRMNPVDGRVILNLLSRALAGETLSIYGDGQQTRSFCYVDDLIDGLIRYGERDICEPLNLGNDAQISILDLALKIQELIGDDDLDIEHFPPVQDEPVHRRPDLTQSLRLLAPWRPKVSLLVGLAHTLAWLEPIVRQRHPRHAHQMPHPEFHPL